jgi:MinD superfamily P-loop ATPase
MMFGLDFDRMLIVCFCCPCHCVARNAGKASEGLTQSFYENCVKFPSVEVSFHPEKCKGCGKCASQCFAHAITFANGVITFDADKCKGCGHCAYICDAYGVACNVQDIDSIINQLDFTGTIC